MDEGGYSRRYQERKVSGYAQRVITPGTMLSVLAAATLLELYESRALYHTLVTCTFAPWRVSRDEEIWAGLRENGVIIYEGEKGGCKSKRHALSFPPELFSSCSPFYPRKGSRQAETETRRERERVRTCYLAACSLRRSLRPANAIISLTDPPGNHPRATTITSLPIEPTTRALLILLLGARRSFPGSEFNDIRSTNRRVCDIFSISFLLSFCSFGQCTHLTFNRERGRELQGFFQRAKICHFQTWWFTHNLGILLECNQRWRIVVRWFVDVRTLILIFERTYIYLDK